MSEVPEVEIIVRDLCEAVVGRVIQTAEVLSPVGLRFPTAPEFVALIANRPVLDANRRAKFILMTLSDDLLLAVHFMIGGKLRLLPAHQPPMQGALILFHLDQDQDLLFADSLGYARAALAPREILVQQLDLDTLGPEILDPSFSVDMLARQMQNRRGVLKSALLNQRVLAGLGNRDTDESLWLAGIDPRRSAASLTLDELARLHDAMRQVLNEGISLRGTQRDLFGKQGLAKQRRNVFERTGQRCPRCQQRISYVRIGGRNTHFCPNCQR